MIRWSSDLSRSSLEIDDSALDFREVKYYRVLAAAPVWEEHLTFDGVAMFSADLQLQLADGFGWLSFDLRKKRGSN